MPPGLAVQPPAPEQEIPQPRARDRCPFSSHPTLFLWQHLSLCPGTRQQNILFHSTGAHHISLALPWSPSPGGQQGSGLGTGHPQSPGPLCLSSKTHLVPAWKERETFVRSCRQAAAPARAWEFCKCSTCTNFFMAVFTVVLYKKWTCVSLLIT